MVKNVAVIKKLNFLMYSNYVKEIFSKKLIVFEYLVLLTRLSAFFFLLFNNTQLTFPWYRWASKSFFSYLCSQTFGSSNTCPNSNC